MNSSPRSCAGEQRVTGGLAGLKGDQRAAQPRGDLALHRLIALEHGAHQPLAVRVGEEIAAVAKQPARGDEELQAHAVLPVHTGKRAAPPAQLFNDHAGILGGHVAHHALDRLALHAVDLLVQNHRLGHLELVALPPHRLDEDGKVQLAAPGNAEGVGSLGILHAQGDVGLHLLHQPRAQVARGDELALRAGEGAVVDAEGHGNVGSSIFTNGRGSAMAGSQMVSPMNSSSKPETATMSPTRALSQGTRLSPSNSYSPPAAPPGK